MLSGSMLYTFLGGQKWRGENPSGAYLLPVLLFLYAKLSGSSAVPKLMPYAKSIPKREEALLLGLSLTCRSITPQTVCPICSPIMGEEASFLGVLA